MREDEEGATPFEDEGVADSFSDTAMETGEVEPSTSESDDSESSVDELLDPEAQEEARGTS